MKLEFVLLELLIGSMIIGGILAHKRSIGERLCLLVSVPVSFALAFLITKLGVFDFVGSLFTDFLLQYSIAKLYLGISMAATSSISSIIAVLMRPVFLLMVFWLFLLIFKIVISVIAKKHDKSLFLRPEKFLCPRNISSIAMGVVGAYVIVMLSCFPLDVVSNIAEPAIDKASEDSYKGTYVNEVVTVIDQKYMPTSDTEFFGKLQKYTGFKSILNATSDSLGDTKLVTNGGKEIEFNVVKLMQELFIDEVDVLALYDHINSPDSRSGAELKHVSNVLYTVADEPMVLAVLPEILDAIETDSPFIKDILQVAHEKYSAEDISLLSEDIEHLSHAVDAISEGAESEKLRKGNVINVILHSLNRSDVSESVVREFSKMSIYSDAVNVLTYHGVGFICDKTVPEAKESILPRVVEVESYTEEDIAAFAKMISAVAEIGSRFNSVDGDAFNVILSDFSAIGTALDAISAFTATADVADGILLAASENETYGKYFADDSVKEMIENVREGNTTYYELFATVEAMYNIANSAVIDRNEVIV